jgi:putative FmdB family regulatory protein
MPTYQYRCPSCGHEFEEFQTMSEDPIEICPSCGKATQRLISGGAGLIFKGSGFYINDYKKKESKKSDLESRESGAKSDAKADKAS